MFFSQASEYALRAVTHLADNPGRPRTAPQIAAATQSSPGYLADVMLSLVRAGVLTSRRGIGGGFSLARPAEQITILDVVNAVDPIQRIERCPLGLESHGHRLCPLHRRLDSAIASIEETFADTTIAEILAEPTTSKPLCEVHSTKSDDTDRS